MRHAIIIPFVIMMLVFVTVVSAQQPEPGQARELLKENIDEVLGLLENDQLSESERRDRIEQVVDPVFKYDLMGMLSLGKQNWSKFSPEQRKTFTERFVNRLKASYFDKIVLYQGDSDARVSYGESRVEGNKVHVPVNVRAKGSTIEMLYKFYPDNGKWRIYDVEINGVSIVQSYRAQFRQILSRGSVEDLLEELKKADSIEDPS